MSADDAYWKALPLGPGVQLITRDSNGVAGFSKPEGILSHPNTPKDQSRSLLCSSYDLDEECFTFEGGRLWLLNRLDSATSGLLLACSDASLAKGIRAQFRLKHIRKVYQALVFGTPRESAQIWKDSLQVVKKQGQIRTGAGLGIPSETRMVLVKKAAGARTLSMIRLEPRTGRSHQLRVQCSKRSLPIVGDQTYGDFKANRDFAKKSGTKRMFLHSLETSFSYEKAGRSFSFSAQAPLPEEFSSILAG